MSEQEITELPSGDEFRELVIKVQRNAWFRGLIFGFIVGLFTGLLG